MTSNVGLTTPRGSGTSGYIQRNLSTLKPRATGFGAPYPPLPGPNSSISSPYQQRQPDQAILSHDRQRQIEIQIFDLRDQLEEGEEEEEDEKGSKLGEEEIERRCEELRERLVDEWEREKVGKKGGGTGGKGGRGLKPHQVHELAEAKIRESERLRMALGIGEGREGRVWDDGHGDRRRRRREEGEGGRGNDGRDREEKGERVGERERERESDRSSIKRERDSAQR